MKILDPPLVERLSPVALPMEQAHNSNAVDGGAGRPTDTGTAGPAAFPALRPVFPAAEVSRRIACSISSSHGERRGFWLGVPPGLENPESGLPGLITQKVEKPQGGYRE